MSKSKSLLLTLLLTYLASICKISPSFAYQLKRKRKHKTADKLKIVSCFCFDALKATELEN